MSGRILWRGIRPVLWLFVLLALALPLPGRAEYDQDAEIARLIERAKADKSDATAALATLKATREKLKQQFLNINNTEQQLAENLKRIRTIDARNKAMLVITTGLNITAVNAPEKLAEAVTSVVVDTASEYLRNNYPALFDSSVTVVLPKLGLDSVETMRAFNTTMAMNDAAVEQRIFAEDPAFAQDVANRGWLQKTMSGDKLSDQLIALKRAQFQILDGTRAEQALAQLKRELLARQGVILQAIAALEQEEKRLEQDIYSWERHRDATRVASSVPPVPNADPPVYTNSPTPDFGTAANKMRDALARLRANQVDCNGYNTLVSHAQWSAYDLFQRQWAAQVGRVCWSTGWSGDACRSAVQSFDATIRRDYDSQIGGANKFLSEAFDAERPAVASFRASLLAWQAQEITVPSFGPSTTKSFQPTSGDAAASAVWSESELGLSAGYLDAYWSDLRVVRGAPPLLADIERVRDVLIAHALDLDHDLALALSADSRAMAVADAASGLAAQWEPKLYLWSCVAGTPALNDQSWLRTLKAFSPVYKVHAETGRQMSKRYREAVGERQSLLASMASAYRGESAILRAGRETGEVQMKLMAVARESGVNLRSADAGFTLWRIMTNAGVTQAMVKELSEVNPKLANEPFVLEYVQTLQAGFDPRRRPVLASAALARLRTDLTSAASRIVPVYNDYQSLYAQLKRKQSDLDQSYRALRMAVEGVLGEPAEYIVAPQFLDTRYLLDAADFADPTAGVFEQLDAYEKLAADYHAQVDPLHPASFSFITPMDELTLKLQRERGALMIANASAFGEGLSEIMSEAEKLTASAVRLGGTMGPKALFGKSRARLMALYVDINTAYVQQRDIAEVVRQLNLLVAGVSGFLASPPTEGGASVAQNWAERVDGAIAPSGRASTLRADRGVASLLDQLATLRDKLAGYRVNTGEALLQKFYQDFAATYQARNLRGLLRFMAPDWRASDGSDLRDLEDILDNSFRVFNSIAFVMSGLTVTPTSDGRFTVRYTATITGRINQMNLNHQETAQVEDTVTLTPSGPRIQASHGGRIWLKR